MIVRAASTSSTVIRSRYWARGLRLPWIEFFAATIAKCLAVEPYCFMCFFAIMA
ncbi:hypothetical protein D3C84_1082570 [compost metagenome]